MDDRRALRERIDALRIDRKPTGTAVPSCPNTKPAGLRRRRIRLGRLGGTIGIAFTVALIAAAGVHLAGRRAAPPDSSTSSPVTAATADGPVVELTAAGYVVAERRAKLSSEVTAKIVSVAAVEGASVHKGDVLYALDASTVTQERAVARARSWAATARAKVARAALASIQQRLDRENILAEAGAVPGAGAKDLAAEVAVSAAQVRAAEADSAVALGEVETFDALLPRYTVKAPFDGVVAVRFAEEGDVAAPGTPLVEIVETSSLRLDADVPEAKLAVIRAGAQCEIVFDALPDRRFAGEVLAIGPRVSRAKATAVVKVRLLERPETLREDMAARVSFFKPASSPR
jgi:HlyD family secretion protein